MPHDPELAATIAKRMARDNLSFRALALALGMDVSAAATLNRIVRGERVSADARRDIARRLGMVRPARKLIRVVMTPAEYTAWRQCPKAERTARLRGASTTST